MKSARRRSRELATQGLYQWLLSGSPAGEIDAQLRGAQGYDKADHEHLDAILHGVIRDSEALSADLTPCLDRPIDQLSPVERAVLLVAAYELKNHVDIPYRVVINEAVELAKTFGGSDGYKYVNGVLDKLSVKLREAETQAAGRKQ
ncbi:MULTISPECIES: transcription antitermination factor NusB [Paraburkholderia]|jgi:N utilization substance protein B|uniref:Transcription antitermination protein NusB n=5 Tax=Paraburkholderia TaxID=1822464 RepID=A0A7Z7FKU3_9BURK|nr:MULTISPECIES: transcription antitermination factor NusB [Paraburkholderia]EUC17244.1 NusB antitermination factor [Burkholderia sp. BT03]SKC70536.1 NusB antitermination factor [Burkholderia sp. CF099]SOE55818.1 NusB antitermination factor [Burkholderia sp. YR290]ALP63733.1 N utilization substance protein B [Paraburkholderia caribensis]AMV41735.1 N utilization substance protein B [Paraburkholderia caribensis]